MKLLLGCVGTQAVFYIRAAQFGEEATQPFDTLHLDAGFRPLLNDRYGCEIIAEKVALPRAARSRPSLSPPASRPRRRPVLDSP